MNNQLAYENVILVVMVLGALFFGARRLPELARSLGKAQSEFEKARIEALHQSSINFSITSDSSNNNANRKKLEEAARAAGIQNIHNFSDDDLRNRILKNLE